MDLRRPSLGSGSDGNLPRNCRVGDKGDKGSCNSVPLEPATPISSLDGSMMYIFSADWKAVYTTILKCSTDVSKACRAFAPA